MSFDYSVVFNLVKMIIVAILKSAGVFDELAAAGLNIDNILAMLGVEPTAPAEPSK